MKLIEEMTGLEKSATLLVSLGADIASNILKYLDEETVFKISKEITKIEGLSIEDREDLIGEFLLDLKKNKGAIYGGENVARDLLKKAFGNDKADQILNQLTQKDLEKGFNFLKNIDAEILKSLLENEHPQIITVTLSYLAPEQTAAILKNLPAYLSKDIIKRMAKLEKSSPEAVLGIVRVLRNKYKKLNESVSKFEKTDGINTIVDILNQMGPDQERKIMDYFEIHMPNISDEIKDKIFCFENILNLSHQEIQILIDEIGDDYLIAIALKGAGDEIRFKFLRNMSQNRATDIINEMDSMGPVRLAEINDARNDIIYFMKLLNDNGSITIRKGKEKLVE